MSCPCGLSVLLQLNLNLYLNGKFQFLNLNRILVFNLSSKFLN